MQFTSPPGVQYTTDPVTGGITLQAGGVAISSYVPPVSRFTKVAILAPPIRQNNAVRDLSQNINDAQYCGAITDAEVYDTEAGALSVGQSTSKALAFHYEKMLWDLSAGESLFIQARVKTVGASTSSNVLFGNSDSTVEGLALTLYGPTHATTPGRFLLSFKAAGASGQAIVMTPYSQSTTAVALDTSTTTDTFFNVTLFIDGATRVPTLWVNGKLGAPGSALNAGSTINPTPRNFGLGYAPVDATFTTSACKATRFQAFRMAVFPSSTEVVNPGLLDIKFNENPRILFNDFDYIGSAA